MDYKEQIKSPLWQKRRLEILSRDNFTCQICGCKDKTLHVHHTTYLNGKMIWEYPDNMLITMCEDCHKKEHQLRYENIKVLEDFRKLGVTNHEISLLLNSSLEAFMAGYHFQLDSLTDFLLSISDSGYNYIYPLAKRRENCLNPNKDTAAIEGSKV